MMDSPQKTDAEQESKMESPVAAEAESTDSKAAVASAANGTVPQEAMEQTSPSCPQNGEEEVHQTSEEAHESATNDVDKSADAEVKEENADSEEFPDGDAPKRFKRDREAEQYRKLFIGGLDVSTTDEELGKFYSQWGVVVDCIVMRDPQTKKSRGFGFVTYSENDMVDKAMAARPHIIDSKEVESKRAVPREFSGKFENHVSVKKLYVSGIKEEHTEDMMKEYFSTFGKVEEVEIIIDKNTGRKRGFAFVLFDDYDSVDKCVLQRSHMIDAKRCDVKKALTREEMSEAEARNRDRNLRQARSRGGDDRWGGGGGFGGGGYGYGGAGGQSWNNWGGQGGWGGGGGGYNQGWGGGGGGGYGRGGGYGGGGGWGNQGYGSQGSWGAGGQWNQGGYDSNSWRGGY